MLDVKNMSKERREAEIDKILAETARSPYKKVKPRFNTPVNRPSAPVHTEHTENKVSETPKAAEQQVKAPEPIKTAEMPKIPEPEKNVSEDFEKTQVIRNSQPQKPLTFAQSDTAEKIRRIKEARNNPLGIPHEEKPEEIFHGNAYDTYEDDEDYSDDGYDSEYDEDEYFYPEEQYTGSERNVSGIVLSIVEAVFTALFIVMFIFTYVFGNAVVSGDSMKPTLDSGDRVLTLAFGSVKSGDIAVINDKKAYLVDGNGKVSEKDGLDCRIIKRIIAVGGDTIDIDFEKGIVYVNGDALDEPYISEPTTRDEEAFSYPLTVPDGYCFVMCDNRNISKDSRHSDVGLVSTDEIEGKALLRVYPFGKIGKVK